MSAWKGTLGTESLKKKDWKSVLPKLSFAYNSTHHSSTGFTPFYLMFGKESRLPIDDMFREVQMEDKVKLRERSHREFVKKWRSSMAEAFKLAKEKNQKSQAYNKKKYDSRVKEVGIEMGDQVLVENLRDTGGTGKLRSNWERQIFVVVDQQGELPVYDVQNLDNPKDVRRLHRNHLMKCDQLSPDAFEGEELEGEQQKVKKPSTRGKKDQSEVVPVVEDPDGEREDEEDIVVVVHPDTEQELVIEGGDLEIDPEIEEAGGVPEAVVEVPDGEESEEDVTFYGFESEPDTPEADAVAEQIENESEDSEEEEEEVLRRSSRLRTGRKNFTFETLGGETSWASGIT